MKNKTILITGGAGFIGTNLTKELISRGNKVISLDIRKPQFGKPIVSNIIDPSWIDKVGKVDYVFHLAATVGVDYVSEHPFETMNTEIYGMSNIIKYAIKYKPRKIIYTSSSVVYGNKDNAQEKNELNTDSSYGVAKYLAEIYLKELKKKYNIDFSTGRLFNVYGFYQNQKMVIAKWIDLAFKNKDIMVYGDGQQTRDFTFIDDVTKVLIMMATNPKANGELFNIGSGKGTKLFDVANSIKNLSGSQSKIIFKKPSKKIEKFDSIRKRYCNNSKVGRILGFKKWISLPDGLRATIRLLKK